MGRYVRSSELDDNIYYLAYILNNSLAQLFYCREICLSKMTRKNRIEADSDR